MTLSNCSNVIGETLTYVLLFAYLLSLLFLPSSERTRSSKTAVDQTVASVLTHQAAITRQLLQSLHRHNCRTQNPDTVPVFLCRATGLLSDYVLGKVRQQWDLFTVALKDASCKKRNSEPWLWDVAENGKMYASNYIE
ncbi:hypothetical protein JG688_00016525 [Phytophthora aleatoria]|uniref:Uncharacterized protein n=1 Tax=Phytophthora aleatoria TaxID=2496075 RepID=A0A8J5MCE1_9STRA|nr:hypothetical protein JG688_00016525 [Phytophthora aleatoria]